MPKTCARQRTKTQKQINYFAVTNQHKRMSDEIPSNEVMTVLQPTVVEQSKLFYINRFRDETTCVHFAN